jgi:hypothetical protein
VGSCGHRASIPRLGNPLCAARRRTNSGEAPNREGAGIATVGRRPGPVVAAAIRPRALTVAVLDGTLILRVGLALLFFANALVAWINPDEFRTLLEKAHVDRIIDPDFVIWVIRVNDAAVAAALIFAWPRFPRLVAA